MLKTNEKENVFELHILGTYEMNARRDLKLIIEEICQNPFFPYIYEVTTFFLESRNEFQNVTNLIEYHHNLNEHYKSSEFKICNDTFYNGVDYLHKIDEYITISKYYLKYLTNSYVNFEPGTCRIVEMTRCEENMNVILTSLGYKEKFKIKKRGEIIKFKNSPIVILLTSMDYDDGNSIGGSGTGTGNKKEPIIIIEIIGFCYESEKDTMQDTLKSIKDKLAIYCVYDGDNKSSK